MYQYFEDAIEPEERDLEHKVVFPSKTTFKGRRWANWDKNSREKKIRNTDGRLVVTHNDADGLVSGALFKDFFDSVEIVTIDYENIESTLEYIYEEAEIDELYVSDLNLDEVYEVIEEISSEVSLFKWIDHHEWGQKQERVSEMGVDITVNQDRCAAGLVFEYVKNRGYQPTESVQETVKMTEDHDLWNHEMRNITLGAHKTCISQAFSQIAFYSDTEKFLEEILEYGEDFMSHEEELLRGDNGSGFLAQKVSEHKMKVEYIIDNETEIKEIQGYKVAFCHGRASPGDLLEELNSRHEVDIVIHTKPTYPVKASIRSTGEFTRCHEVAERLGGGGHEQAAGCKPDMIQEPMEFMEFILERGQSLKDEVESALREELE